MKSVPAGAVGFAFIGLICAAAPAQAQSKDPPGVNPAHYQCYRIGQAEGFKPQGVRLADQFGRSEARVLRPVLLCTPVSKNGAPVRDRRTHLVCYEQEGGKPADKRAVVENQFGRQFIAVGAPALLCVPSLKKVRK